MANGSRSTVMIAFDLFDKSHQKGQNSSRTTRVKLFLGIPSYIHIVEACIHASTMWLCDGCFNNGISSLWVFLLLILQLTSPSAKKLVGWQYTQANSCICRLKSAKKVHIAL